MTGPGGRPDSGGSWGFSDQYALCGEDVMGRYKSVRRVADPDGGVNCPTCLAHRAAELLCRDAT